MPRKPKITAVPVEQEECKNEGLMVVREEPDEKTDAEQMTEIIKEVQEEPKEEPKEEPQEVVPAAPVVAKAKAKRASRAKPKEEPKEAPKEEPKEQPKEKPIEEPKGEEKVACSDCGKQMSANTLKYSHGPNCNSKKQTKKASDKNKQQTSLDFTADVVEHHSRARTLSERATRREAIVEKLMQTAF